MASSDENIPPDTSNWADITQDFNEAVKDLKLGELLHDDLFGLFEAMSAIEMMDPKMDAGMLCNRGNKAPLTFAQAVEKGVVKVDAVPIADQIAIIDTTWACMVSWLDGHSSAQTVFTNLYLHDPHLIEDRSLKAYCIAIYKIIDLIKLFVTRGLVFEEEDFQLTIYGYRLQPEVSDVKATAMLREAEDDLARRRRIAADPQQDALLNALALRIKFTKLLLQAFLGLNRKDVNPATVAESVRLLTNCSDLTTYITGSVYLASPPAYISELHGPVAIGFDPMVNQRLLPPTFPRYTHIKPPGEAYARLDDLFARLRQVSKICSYTSFHTALELMLEVSCTKPCIISRSVMQFLYLPQYSRAGDMINCIDALKEAARTFISPPVLMPRSQVLNSMQPSSHHLQVEAKEFLDRFLKHCVRPFSNLIQLCGYNRARQRDKLAHLLPEFATLQDESERVDVCLHNLFQKCEVPRPHLACFGTWVLYHTLRVMIMFLLSGFELELYNIHEYHYIYWYLYDFLYGWLISSLSRADNFMNEQENITEHSKAKKRNRIRTRKRKPFTREITLYQGLQNLCGGYYKAMVGFRKDGRIKLPHPEFDCERVRYEHRFAPFNAFITPPPVQYSEFKDMTASYTQAESHSLYWAACKHFLQARTFLESLHNPEPEVLELVRIAKMNFIVTRLLATTTPKNDSTRPPLFDFSVHHHFPIIKMFT